MTQNNVLVSYIIEVLMKNLLYFFKLILISKAEDIHGELFFNQSTLFNEGDTQQSSTDKHVALEFTIELKFRNVFRFGYF